MKTHVFKTTVIDAATLQTWAGQLSGLAADIDTLVLDFSRLKSFDDRTGLELGRWLRGPAAASGRRVLVLCQPETELGIEEAGLGGLVQCFPANLPEAPAAHGAEGAFDREDISAICGHLISGVERVTGVLFDEGLAYRPPVAPVKDISREIGPGVEGALVRVESPDTEMRMLFLVRSDDKKQLSRAYFRGREVPEEATRDLLAELANNVIGDVLRHMPAKESSRLKPGIPETLEPPANPAEEDLRRMHETTSMLFLNENTEIKLIIGWSPKC